LQHAEEFQIKDSVLEMLLEKAELQGQITRKDILEAFPDVNLELDQLHAIMQALQFQGIEVEGTGSKTETKGNTLEVEMQTDMDPYINLASISSDDTVSLYLREMSRVPLLKKEEEFSLAKRIERGKESYHELLRLDGNCTSWQKADLKQFIEDGKQARNHLIKANTRLVVSVAKRYNGRGVPFLDLIQEGNLGLMKAVEKFDYKRGFRFSTYATWWIRQTITRAIADQGRTIRVPVHMVDRIRRMYKLIYALEQKLNRAPTIEELAKFMEMEKRKVEWMLRVSWLPLSLESPVTDDEDESELGHFMEDKVTPTPIQSVYSKLLREKVYEVLETLPCREARILRLRFGLEDGKFYTLEQVGNKFGLTRERIRQIENKALRRLRHPRRSRQLKGYV
jgi:RNA polymerase primary sigma factor